MESLNQQVQILKNKGAVDYKKHLGGGIYFSVVSGFDCVNLRRYWIPNGSMDGSCEPVPTKGGIGLKFSEWDVLVDSMEEIRNCHQDLLNARLCIEGLDHLNQMGEYRCRECNPFGYLQYAHQ